MPVQDDPTAQPAPPALTEARVREIVREELEKHDGSGVPMIAAIKHWTRRELRLAQVGVSEEERKDTNQ